MRRAALLLLLPLALAACGGDGDDSAATATTPAEPATTAAEAPSSGCRDVAQPGARTPPPLRAPTTILAAPRPHRLTFETNCGDFTVELDLESAPKTAASLVALAKADYFDGTYFHRIVPGFVIQGGDPTGTGTGGPGYSTVDPPAPDARYTKGVVAMAKTGAEAPGTAGSQFFVLTGDDIGLPPHYAVGGEVVEGLDVVERIGILGDPSTELPTQPVVIEDVVVEG